MARKIVVFGSLNRDVVLRVPHLPIEGETVLGGAIDDYFGGKGSNQAVAAARLGAEVALIGRVGNDATGKEMIDTLARENIDVTGIEIDRETPTGVALIMVDAEGRNIIAVSPGANGVVGELEVERLRTALEEDDVLVVQLEIPALAAKSALKTAFRIGARVILNATPVDDSTFELLDGVDFVVVNAREAATLFKRRVESASTAGKVAADVQRYGRAGTVIVTLGAAGAVLRSSDTAIDVPGFKVESVDSVGAGDAFVGGLAASLLRGDSIEDVIRFGCAAGAVATTRYGAQPSLPALQELDGLLNGGGRTTGLELV